MRYSVNLYSVFYVPSGNSLFLPLSLQYEFPLEEHKVEKVFPL